MNLPDTITAYAIICAELSQHGHEILKSGKPYDKLSVDEIGVAIRHIITTSPSEREVHERIIKELKIDNNFSIQASCSPNASHPKKSCLATGALATKDGTKITVTITRQKKEDWIII